MVEMDIAQETDDGKQKCKNCSAPAEIGNLCKMCHNLYEQHGSGNGLFAEEVAEIKKTAKWKNHGAVNPVRSLKRKLVLRK